MDELILQDLEVAKTVLREMERQTSWIELVPSENYCSPAVRQAAGTVLTHKYADGYPGERFYGGCDCVDAAEDLARDRARELFGLPYANVQPYSGSIANIAAFAAVLSPGDAMLALDFAQGGHFTHGWPGHLSGKTYRGHFHQLDPETLLLDYDAIERLAQELRPKLIIAGYSAYPRQVDFARFRAIADEVGALLLADIAHIAGLIAAGRHPTPAGRAHIVTTTTHKTLRGPRGGMILANSEFGPALDEAVFPGVQGGPLMHVIAAKAVALGEALRPGFAPFQDRVLSNAAALAQTLIDLGYTLVTGGTDTHLMLVDLRPQKLTGKEAAAVLEKVQITVNKHTIPFDPTPLEVGAGIRLGSPAATTRGMRESHMRRIAQWIDDALRHRDNETRLASIRLEVEDFARGFPLFSPGPH